MTCHNSTGRPSPRHGHRHRRHRPPASATPAVDFGHTSRRLRRHRPPDSTATATDPRHRP
ncbi:hypothetical protein LT493_44860 [Streptomyces tricolor]|nr:hypothetical protein [Streptomyces tricolor]